MNIDLENFVSSFVTMLSLNEARFGNKYNIERDVMKDIIESNLDFGRVTLLYNNHHWTIDLKNGKEDRLEVDVKTY